MEGVRYPFIVGWFFFDRQNIVGLFAFGNEAGRFDLGMHGIGRDHGFGDVEGGEKGARDLSIVGTATTGSIALPRGPAPKRSTPTGAADRTPIATEEHFFAPKNRSGRTSSTPAYGERSFDFLDDPSLIENDRVFKKIVQQNVWRALILHAEFDILPSLSLRSPRKRKGRGIPSCQLPGLKTGMVRRA